MTATTAPRPGWLPHLTQIVLGATVLLVCVAVSLVSPFFLTGDNLSNLLGDLALVGILAMPATFLMMSGHVDLSVGAGAAFTGILLAATAPDVGMVAAILLAVGAGLLIGLLNGLLVTYGQINSIAATFAVMALLRGLAYLIPSGLAVAVSGFRALGNTILFLGITVPMLILGGVVALAAGLSRSGTGRRTRAIGQLPAADRLAGRRNRIWVVALFAASGLAAALVGLIRTSQLGTGLPTAALGVELVVLTAVLLGGGRLTGGKGSIAGTVLALLLIAVVDNGLSLMNITAYASQVFHAFLLIVALLLYRPRRDRSATEVAPVTSDADRRGSPHR